MSGYRRLAVAVACEVLTLAALAATSYLATYYLRGWP